MLTAILPKQLMQLQIKIISPLRVPHLPVHRVMPPIANVDCNLSECGLKHRMASGAFHVVGGLIEISNTRDVVLCVWAGEGRL